MSSLTFECVVRIGKLLSYRQYLNKFVIVQELGRILNIDIMSDYVQKLVDLLVSMKIKTSVSVRFSPFVTVVCDKKNKYIFSNV